METFSRNSTADFLEQRNDTLNQMCQDLLNIPLEEEINKKKECSNNDLLKAILAVSKEVKGLREEVSSLKNKIIVQEQNIILLQSENRNLKQQLDVRERECNYNKVIITGPKVDANGNDIESIKKTLISSIGFELKESSINSCVNIPSKGNSTTPSVLLSLTTSREKDILFSKYLAHRKSLKGSIFINERLTKKNMNIFYHLRKLRKCHNFGDLLNIYTKWYSAFETLEGRHSNEILFNGRC